jgi:hypothetical protein
MSEAETVTRTYAGATLTVLLDSDDPASAIRALGAAVDRQWRRGEPRSNPALGVHAYSGFELSSSLAERADPNEHAEQLIQRLRPLGPALRGIGRHPATHSIRLTVAEHTRSDNPVIGLDAAAISLLAAIGAEVVGDIYFYGNEDE